MRVCYVDEAGCTGTIPDGTSSIQPVFILSGAVFEQSRLYDLTNDFLTIKRRYFPSLTANGSHYLDQSVSLLRTADPSRRMRLSLIQYSLEVSPLDRRVPCHSYTREPPCMRGGSRPSPAPLCPKNPSGVGHELKASRRLPGQARKTVEGQADDVRPLAPQAD